MGVAHSRSPSTPEHETKDDVGLQVIASTCFMGAVFSILPKRDWHCFKQSSSLLGVGQFVIRNSIITVQEVGLEDLIVSGENVEAIRRWVTTECGRLGKLPQDMAILQEIARVEFSGPPEQHWTEVEHEEMNETTTAAECGMEEEEDVAGLEDAELNEPAGDEPLEESANMVVSEEDADKATDDGKWSFWRFLSASARHILPTGDKSTNYATNNTEDRASECDAVESEHLLTCSEQHDLCLSEQEARATLDFADQVSLCASPVNVVTLITRESEPLTKTKKKQPTKSRGKKQKSDGQQLNPRFLQSVSQLPAGWDRFDLGSSSPDMSDGEFERRMGRGRLSVVGLSRLSLAGDDNEVKEHRGEKLALGSTGINKSQPSTQEDSEIVTTPTFMRGDESPSPTKSTRLKKARKTKGEKQLDGLTAKRCTPLRENKEANYRRVSKLKSNTEDSPFLTPTKGAISGQGKRNGRQQYTN